MSKDKPAPKAINTATAKQLIAFMERADRLYDEIADTQALLKDLWIEAKGVGFEPKEIDGIVKTRRKDPDNEKIKQSVRDVYLKALALDMGELGRWARARDLAESAAGTRAALATADVKSSQMVDAFAVAHGLDDSGEALERLSQMDSGTRPASAVTTTVSINGGPEVPLETLKRAVKRVKRGAGGGVIAAMEQAVTEELAEAGP